ncbi:unnamed protein product [Parascedosporium putredinis]|uniref:Uncharacterized protein n=1 Tax=Parascedosporium putredinis TaxID=1442378 RepID=A0A9P1HAL1_9PEZI|nr:unnamed protein product [Parascedosporium putredinis]CAI8002823.1 unnamed protein product [Parascedosporium putredinis]
MDLCAPSVALDGPERVEFEELEKRFFNDLGKAKAQITVRLEESTREKAMLERKLQAVCARMREDNTSLEKLTQDYRVNLAKLATSRRKAYYDMQDHFKKNRDEGPLIPAIISQLRNPHLAQVPGDAPEDRGEQGQRSDDAAMGILVHHSDGHVIAPLKKLPMGSPWVDALLRLPVKRDVHIRAGRKFNSVNLDPIYAEMHGTKPSKWVAFMIQAVGEVQSSPCGNCTKPGGLFAECIKVPTDMFGRCGNCEWSRQACHVRTVIPDSQETVATADVEMKDVDTIPPASILAPLNRGEDGDSRHSLPLVMQRPPSVSGKRVLAPKPGTALEPRPPPLLIPGASEAVMSHRPIAPAPPRGGGPLVDESLEARKKSPANVAEFDPAEREKLVNPTISLVNDGSVYTHPELVAGVPLGKINEEHPYWDPAWKDPVALTKSVLAGYKEKHEASLSDVSGARPSHAKFLLGRQVKRGYVILEFLESGPFHPYQFVAKKWTSPGIITYDTLYRLAATLSELERFKIKVSPADWLRQRFYEIMLAEGEQFNLTKTLKDFYHDPKLKALRSLSGFGNIGRPSGAKGGAEGTSKSPKADRQRRKDAAGNLSNASSPAGTPRPRSDRGPRLDFFISRLWEAEDEKRVTAPPDVALAIVPTMVSLAAETAATTTPATPVEVDEFAYEGFTDTDSLCGDSVDNDDYNVRQVRTRQHTTPEEGAQYWHFIQHYDDLGTWELHLLQRADPPDWVRYDPPFNFGVFLDEIVAVTHHPGTLKIHVRLTVPESGEGTAGYVKGEAMAWFKRERTKRRLLTSCRDKGIALKQAESAEDLERTWVELGEKSQQLNGVLEAGGEVK